jgi:regulator of protease activity HflC (stomatin/prohibitin superfamily)
LRQVVLRELARYATSADMLDFIGPRRQEAAETVKARINEEIGTEARKLGLEVLLVGLADLHPPVETGLAFEDVVGAMEAKEATILESQIYQMREVPLARAEAKAMRAEARGYRMSRIAVSKGEAERFLGGLQAYRAAPDIYVMRRYLDTLEEALQGVRKVIRPPWARTDEVLQLDLQERIQSGLLELETQTETD